MKSIERHLIEQKEMSQESTNEMKKVLGYLPRTIKDSVERNNGYIIKEYVINISVSLVMIYSFYCSFPAHFRESFKEGKLSVKDLL